MQEKKSPPWEETQEPQTSLIIEAEQGKFYAFPYISYAYVEGMGKDLAIFMGPAKVMVTLSNDSIHVTDLLEAFADNKIRRLSHDPDKGLLVAVEFQNEDDKSGKGGAGDEPI